MENSGSAFPIDAFVKGVQGDKDIKIVNLGLTKREWFAGMALIGMQAHPADEDPKSVANWCYRVADEMLTASKEKSDG